MHRYRVYLSCEYGTVSIASRYEGHLLVVQQGGMCRDIPVIDAPQPQLTVHSPAPAPHPV